VRSFLETQRRHSERADAAHFAWQTGAPWFAESERALLDGVRATRGERLLEIGCGEGGNLWHLGTLGAWRVGVDWSPAKAAFARRSTGAEVAAADAARLPFADASFDAVLIRDLLHHLRPDDRAPALAEARRVLKPGGRLTLVEPNRRSPLVLLQAALVRAERGLFRSTAERLRGELAAAGFAILDEETRQPLPIARVLLHPRLGAARLTAFRPARFVVTRALDALDRAAARLVPRRAWLYLVFHARRP
jgi:SAM-dependent methyltransferase